MEYINGKANGRQTRASARRSIDGVIELICQFANYTDEFVWWPPPRGRVSLFIDRERIGGWLLAVVSRACAWNRGVRRTCVRACVRAPARQRITAWHAARIQRAQLARRRGGSYWFSGYTEDRGELDFRDSSENPCEAAREKRCFRGKTSRSSILVEDSQLSGTRHFPYVERTRKRHWILNFEIYNFDVQLCRGHVAEFASYRDSEAQREKNVTSRIIASHPRVAGHCTRHYPIRRGEVAPRRSYVCSERFA